MVQFTSGFLFKRRHFLGGKSMNWKKFLCAIFFGLFATHLLLLRDRASAKNAQSLLESWLGGKGNNNGQLPSKSYNQFVDDYLHQNRTFDNSHLQTWMKAKNRSFVLQITKKPKIIWRKVTEEKPRPHINVSKILLLSSNPRSGSSFTGELLSAMPNVSYYFEPLWFFGANPNKSLTEKMQFVSNLMDCHYMSLRRLLSQTKSRSFIFKKPSILPDTNLRTMSLADKRQLLDETERQCHLNPYRIAKFFRLRLADILPIMSDPKSVLGHKFNVIMLLRDPRAIINSLLKAPHEWVNLAPNPKMACTNIYNDMTAFNSIGSETLLKRIMVVKYEDLVDNPYKVASQMYNFMGTEDLIQYANEYLDSHINVEVLPKPKGEEELKQLEDLKRSNLNFDTINNLENNKELLSKITPKLNEDLEDYFTTIRNRTFHHDHWRNELNETQLKDIESFPDCQSVIEMLEYN